MVTDPIADFIIRFQNAARAGHERFSVPYSSMKHEIAKLLEREGYVTSLEVKGDGVDKEIGAGVVYVGNSPRIHEAKRVSKPSRRLYAKAKEIKPYKYGKGLSVISTPLGLLTDKEAREKNVGGETLFTLW